MADPGQRQRVAERFGRGQPARSKKRALGADLHGDHAHAAALGVGQHGGDEGHAVAVGGIERHQHGVEGEAPHPVEQDRRIMVAGQPEVAHPAIGLGLGQRLDGAAFGDDAVEIGGGAQVVQLPQVEVIGAQPLEAVVEQAQRTVAAAIAGLRGEEDPAPPLAEGSAIVVHAAGVGRSGVAIVHPLVEGAVDDPGRLRPPAVGTQHAFAAEAEQRRPMAGAAERAGGEGGQGGHPGWSPVRRPRQWADGERILGAAAGNPARRSAAYWPPRPQASPASRRQASGARLDLDIS